MEGFPDAYTVLVEPNEGFREPIERLMANRRGEVHFIGAGPREAAMTLTLNVRQPTSSTMSKPSGTQIEEYASRGWTRKHGRLCLARKPANDEIGRAHV